MTDLPLEVLALEPMASGGFGIRLTRRIAWEGFGAYAHELVRALGGEIVDRADSPVERVRTATIDGRRFWIAFEDFALGVSLDPCDADAAARIEDVRSRLMRLRSLETNSLDGGIDHGDHA